MKTLPQLPKLPGNQQPRKFSYVLKVPFSKRRENHVFSNPENWNAQNAENCDAVYKIRMLKMPKIAMLSTKHFLSLRGYQVTDNPENSITF